MARLKKDKFSIGYNACKFSGLERFGPKNVVYKTKGAYSNPRRRRGAEISNIKTDAKMSGPLQTFSRIQYAVIFFRII